MFDNRFPAFEPPRRRGRGGRLHRRPRRLASRRSRAQRAEALMWVWRHRYVELGARDGRRVRDNLREPRRRGRRHAAPPARADLRLPVPAARSRRSSWRPTRGSAAARRARCWRASWTTARRVLLESEQRRRLRPVRRALGLRSARRDARAPRQPARVRAARAARARRGPAGARARLRRAVRAALPLRDGRAPGADARRPAPATRGHLHVEFYPPLRTAEKLKYLAGSEQGAGTFISDTLPEESAAALREAIARAA